MIEYPSRFVHLPAARLRWGDRVDRVGAFYSKGDPLADDVVRELETAHRAERWAMINEAAARGIATIQNPPPGIRRFFEAAETVPAWVDWAVCDRGGKTLMRAGLLGGIVLSAASLILGYASPGGNKPLVFSGRLESQATRRLNETARFVQAVCRPSGTRPFADGYQITLKVRLMHAQVRALCSRDPRWKQGDWGLAINQHDMAGTVILFSYVVLSALRKLGMPISAREGEHYMHLWRWVGHLIGVDPELNCASEGEADRYAELVRATEAEPDDDSRALTRALLTAEVREAKTPRQLRVAKLRSMMGHTFSRHLLGDELADQLAIGRTPMRHTGPLWTRVISASSLVVDRVPLAERGALVVGTRYWDRVVEIGLAGAMAEFGLPERLRAA